MADWKTYKGEGPWEFAKQANKWGYLNNPRWTDTPVAPISYDGRESEEPQVWTDELARRDATGSIEHKPCGHWHRQEVVAPPTEPPVEYPLLVNGYQQAVGICSDHLIIAPMWYVDGTTQEDGIVACKYNFSTGLWSLEGTKLGDGAPTYAYPGTCRTRDTFTIYYSDWYRDAINKETMMLHVFKDGVTLRTVDLWEFSSAVDSYWGFESSFRSADIRSNGLISCMAFFSKLGGVSVYSWVVKTSIDYGVNWTSYTLPTVGPIVVGSHISGNLRIDETGVIWIALKKSLSSDMTVYIYKSIDNGVSFNLVKTLSINPGAGVTSTSFIVYTISKGDGKDQYIGVNGYAPSQTNYWYSSDYGVNWTLVYTNIWGVTADSMKHMSNGQYLVLSRYTSGTNGVFRRSDNYGTSFNTITPPSPISDSYVDDDYLYEDFAYTECGEYFSGTTLGALYSRDSGATWNIANIQTSY